MAENRIERQLLWYKYSRPVPESHEWYFLLINDKEKMKIITQKIYDSLVHIIERRPIDHGQIENSDLFYDLFCIVTPTPDIDFSKVYQGKVKKDRCLQPRINLDGWNGLIEKVYHGEI
jgi:hypothetical protein